MFIRFTLLFSLILSQILLASLIPMTIPRVATNNFLKQGFFEGGSSKQAVLQQIQLVPYSKENRERWIIGFEKKNLPPFQIQYFPAEKFSSADQGLLTQKPAHFRFLFRHLTKNLLTETQLAQMTTKSRFVSEIVLYPPIEEGDVALEFILRDDVQFEAHQPISPENRLVLDLR